MRQRRKAKEFVDYLRQFIGIPYHYGDDESRGDDPVGGFDCSGLVTEGLRAFGLLPNSARYSAQMLYDKFYRDLNRAETKPKNGCLVFYGTGYDNVTHVAVCYDETSIIEAGGGSRLTKTEGIAAQRNAFVRMRNIDYRKDLVAIADPFMYSY